MHYWASCRLLLAAFLPAIAAAADLPACPPHPIRVAYFEFGVMFNSERGDKLGSGIDRDLVAELEKRSGCRFAASVMTRARMWSETQAGRLDLTLSAIKTPERQALAWMFPYVQMKSVMLLSPRLPAESRTQEGFIANPHAAFGIVRDFRHAPRYEAIIRQMYLSERLQETTDTADLIRRLKSAAIMAAVSNTVVYPRYIDNGEIPGEIIVADWGPEDPPLIAHLMFAKQTFSAAESRKWQALLKSIRRDGTLLAIAERYLDREAARRLTVLDH